MSASLSRLGMLLATGLLGCGSAAEVPVSGQVLGCTDSAACPTPATCVEGACVGELSPTMALGLYIEPGRSSPLGAALIEGLRFEGASVLRLDEPTVLTPKQTVLVRVLTEDGRPVNLSRVSIHPEGVLSIARLAVQPQLHDGNGFISALATSWPSPSGGTTTATYTVNIQPSTLPPFQISGVIFDGPTRTLRAPDSASVVTVRGTLIADSFTRLPVPGAIVAVYDEAGLRVSTATTSDEEGRYSVQLWAAQTDRELILRTGSDAPDLRPIPTLSRAILVPEGPGTVVDQHLVAGQIGTVSMVEGVVSSEMTQVAGAQLTFKAEIGGWPFEQRTLSDADGRFSTLLYPGRYTLDIRPPEGAQRSLRYSRQAVEIAGEATLNLSLGLRAPVSGQVVDSAGRPVADVRVSARLERLPLSDPGLPDVIFEAGPVVVEQTDDEGRFVLALDSGIHAFELTPPRALGLASVRRRIQFSTVDGGAVDLGSLMLPQTAVLSTTLIGPDATPIVGAIVEIWSLEGPSVRLDLTVSDADGQVRLRIPVEESE